MYELDNYRKEIEDIDEDIIRLLDKRMKLSVEVGKLKKEHNLDIVNPKREEEIKQKILSYKSSEIVKDKLLSIYAIIFKTSREMQE